jgi:hypothetical protein
MAENHFFSTNPEDPWDGCAILRRIASVEEPGFWLGQSDSYLYDSVGLCLALDGCLPVVSLSCMPSVSSGCWQSESGVECVPPGECSAITGSSDYKEPAAPQAAEPPILGRGLRLRKRSKVTRSLEYMGGRLRGWWRDLPSVSPANTALAWLAEYSAPGTKLGRVRQVQCGSDADVQESVSVVSVMFGSEHQASRELWVCPELVASLFTVRCFRAVGPDVLSSLRSRARLWARERGVSDLDLSFFLPGTLVLAALPQPDEVVSLGALRSSAAEWSSRVLAPLAKGNFVSGKLRGPRGFWDTLVALCGGEPRDHILSPARTWLSTQSV